MWLSFSWLHIKNISAGKQLPKVWSLEPIICQQWCTAQCSSTIIGTWVWCIVHSCLLMVFKLVATDPHHTKEHIYRDNWQLWPASSDSPSPVKALTLLLRAVHRCPSCTAGTSSTLNSFVASPSFFSFFFPFLLHLLSRRFHPVVVHFSPFSTFHLHFPHPAVSGSSTISDGEQDSVSQFSSLFFYWAVFLSTRQLFFFLPLVLHLWPFLFKVFCLGSLEHLFLFLIICNFVLFFAFLWNPVVLPQSTKFRHCSRLLSFLLFFSASSLLPSSVVITSLFANNGWLYDFAQLCLQWRQQRQQQWLPQWRRQ